MAARVKQGALDQLIVSIYFPSVGLAGSEAIYREMLDWLLDLLSRLPVRCNPILLMDGNARMGLAGSTGRPIETSAMGAYGRMRQNKHGDLLAAFLEDAALFLRQLFSAHGANFPLAQWAVALLA